MRLNSGWGFPAPPPLAPIRGKGRKIYKNRYNSEVSGARLRNLQLTAAGREPEEAKPVNYSFSCDCRKAAVNWI
ncbi:hypothetical protein AV530_004979 [Patagioenas fasciata monilis]|uniref:Uncharacterized protein n=1 Tax=Patagioenas fasciata monilis TaxID=372326 RepID=A0A1V4K3J7_PATFA|nr:hypothetical protein AV530_004979 [Patagioenas fasciata monilis]